MVPRPPEAMEAAQSTKYFAVRSYLSRALVYEVRHVIQNIPHNTLMKKYYGTEAVRGH